MYRTIHEEVSESYLPNPKNEAMNLSQYKEYKPHLARRAIWYLINHTLFRCLKGRPFNPVRIALLRCFGASIDKDAYIYSSCTIFAPWNVKIGRACIGPDTNLYSKDMITVGDDSVVSQGSCLCTASHDISSLMLPLQTAPIMIGNNVWLAADTFVGMGSKHWSGRRGRRKSRRIQKRRIMDGCWRKSGKIY